MQDEMVENHRERSLLIFGSLALIAAVVTGVSDVLLFWGVYDSGSVFDLSQIAGVAPDDVLLGSWLGVASIPFWGFGLLPMAESLSKSARLRATLCGAFAYSIAMFCAVHVLYLCYALAYQPFVPESWLETVLRLRTLVMATTSIAAFGSCLGWAAVVLLRQTHLPRVAAVVNPLTLAILLFAVASVLPPPVGGMLSASAASLAYGLFFFLVAVLQVRAKA